VSSAISANPQGGWTATFSVPASASGAHTIDAAGPTTQAAVVTDITFTVIPGVSISETTGPGGASITATGSGFAASETGISVTYDGAPVASGISANQQGGWSATFSVPDSPSGRHIVDASGPSTQAGNVADTAFDVTPDISVNKTSGSAGGSVTVTGSGFGAGETGISVTYDGQTVASDITATSRGGWTATFVVPPSAAGSHTINASGPVTRLAAESDAGFTIGAGISISPTQGHVGAAVEVSGSGFAANSPLTITYDNAGVLSARVIADASGSFSQSITVPRSQAGAHTIKVTDGEGHSAQAAFSISTDAPPAPALLAPADGGRVGFMGEASPTLEWTPVEDPSGVTYTIQIATFSDFSPVILQKTGIPGNHYTLSSAEALPRGDYYWRVRATNAASVDGEWSQTRLIKSGVISPAGLIGIVLLAAAAAFGVWFVLSRRKTVPQAAVATEPAPAQVVQGEWRVVEPTDDGPRRLPWRLALPEAPKGPRAVSHEDEARLKAIVDFARSIPLI
jgi:hypothetical protein